MGGPDREHRRSLLLTGAALLSVGLVLIGYVVWEYWGTSVVARHNQRQTVDELIDSWKDGTGPRRLDQRSVESGDAIALLRIPAFGPDFVVPVVEGVADDDLARGVGHYPGTALPGRVGNVVVAGHRVTHGEPFRDLPHLEPGARITIETVDAVYTYRLGTDPSDLVVQPNASWVLDPVPARSPYDTRPKRASSILTLLTCGEVFHTTDRMVGFGHLVRTRHKDPSDRVRHAGRVALRE
jgi:sortase A